MLANNNFKRRSHTHSKPRRGAVDGILQPNSARRKGNIGFDRDPGTMKNPMQRQTVDNFNQPEGYNPTEQPFIAAAQTSTSGAATNGLDVPENIKSGRRHKRKLPKTQPRLRGGRVEKSKWRKITKRSSLILLALFILVSGFIGWKIAINASKVFNGSIFGIFDKTNLKGEDQGRVNILLTGNSSDDPGHAGANLTDSIMIISLDTKNNGGFIMSIPRDLWVNYGTNSCSFGREGKINAVYECGEDVEFKEDGFPEGGVGLLEKVIERDFGIDINYFVKLNYTAFREAVNTVGGIDITIKTDDPRGLYDGNIAVVDGGPLKLSNGTHHLNGQTALNLARARCDTVCYGFTRGDFDRTERQREMLIALKDKALSLGILGNPLKISSLLDSIGNNVETDFQTNEIRRLYDLVKQVQNQNIKSVGLADDEVKLEETANIGNSSAVRPAAGTYDFSAIKIYLKQLTSSDPVVREGASAVVLNSSGVDGLARKYADGLISKGISVKTVANSTGRPTTAIVFINSQKTATNNYLQQDLKVTSTTDKSANPEAKNYTADFVIILGADQAGNSSQ